MPPDPLPSRSPDWSSLGSPHTRTSPHSVPDREVEQNVNIPKSAECAIWNSAKTGNY